MFTGLVEEAAPVLSLKAVSEGSALLTVEAPLVAQGIGIGDSVAVNGCCLTVTTAKGNAITFDLLSETLARTNLGALQPGALVHLERALPANGRLGGHFVQGHVDCTAPLIAMEQVGQDHRMEVALPSNFAHYVVYKGSIALNGISLTVAEVLEKSFVVWIIPHTYAVTNLRTLKPGDAINIEFDLLAKYLENLVKAPRTC